jgi:hypothetical protein
VGRYSLPALRASVLYLFGRCSRHAYDTQTSLEEAAVHRPGRERVSNGWPPATGETGSFFLHFSLDIVICI